MVVPGGRERPKVFRSLANPDEETTYVGVTDLLKPDLSSSPETPRSRPSGDFEGSSLRPAVRVADPGRADRIAAGWRGPPVPGQLAGETLLCHERCDN